MDIGRDPITRIFFGQIVPAIDLLIEKEYLAPCLTLIYSTIDNLAYLTIEEARDEVNGNDFKKWCNRYIKFPGKEQINSDDLWGARCGVIHSLSSESRLSRQGSCNQIGYVFALEGKNFPMPVINGSEEKLIIVDIRALWNALKSGMKFFLGEVFKDKNSELAKRVETRLTTLFSHIPLSIP